MRTAKVSQQALDDYNEMIQNTVYGLNLHLQRVDEKLEAYSNTNIPTLNINLDEEKEVTQTCLHICEDAKHFLESLKQKSPVLQDGKDGAMNHEQHGFEAQLLTHQALDKNRDNFVIIISQLQNRLQALILNNDPRDDKEKRRLLEDIDASKQCLEVCKMASEASSQKVYRVGEAVADGCSDQVVANTLADLFDVKKATFKDNSAQLMGSMAREDLRSLAEKRYASRFEALVPQSDPAILANSAVDTDETKSSSHKTDPALQLQSRSRLEKPSRNETRRRTD